jgi:outer membrane lipoprotein SlyB
MQFNEIKKPRRPVDKVFLHCTASDLPLEGDALVSEIRRWHTDKPPKGRGWSDIGYHFLIDKKGTLLAGRPLELIPAAQEGHNTGTIAISVHGMKEFTDASLRKCRDFCLYLLGVYDGMLTFHGHHEVQPNKECPVYDYHKLLNLDAQGRVQEQVAPPVTVPVTLVGAKPMKINLGQKAKQIVDALAPTLGTILGGPLGGLAGTILASVFGTNDTGAIESAILSGNPDALAKLKEAELQAQTRARELDIDLEKLNAADRASARDLAIHTGITPQVVITCVYTIAYFATLYMFVLGDVKASPYEQIIIALITVITTVQIQIANFWFGSSSGSEKKTNILAQERLRK